MDDAITFTRIQMANKHVMMPKPIEVQNYTSLYMCKFIFK